MINAAFWNTVREKWIRNEDPTIAATEEFIQKDGKNTDEINSLNAALNGDMTGAQGSLDDVNSMLEQLNGLGIESNPFDDLFSNMGNQ